MKKTLSLNPALLFILLVPLFGQEESNYRKPEQLDRLIEEQKPRKR